MEVLMGFAICLLFLSPYKEIINVKFQSCIVLCRREIIIYGEYKVTLLLGARR
jgi:hypothetical protein